ncbi:MAG: lyase family protein, partial [Candidatus Binataceae bacterium]
MASTAIDSTILGNFFGTEAMRRIFSDHARVQFYLEVEAALARAQASLGIVPPKAAAEISRQARADTFDFALLTNRTEQLGSTVMPVVEQLAARCGEYGGYCHWGATTQDIADTATVLQIREGLKLVDDELSAISAALASLARRYRDTPMAGRSKLQQ